MVLEPERKIKRQESEDERARARHELARLVMGDICLVILANSFRHKGLLTYQGSIKDFAQGGGQNSCFRVPGGASATCCTIQYIYSKLSRGANIQQGGGGECPPSRPPPLNETL